jgi:hypothetical protein
MARLLSLVAVLAAVIALAGPASAATTTEDRALTAAELQAGTYSLACPSGERIASASASFYRTAKHKNPLGGDDLAPTTTISDANGNPITATWTLPKGAKYVQATLACEPIPPATQTITEAKQYTGSGVGYVSFACPAGWVALSVTDAIGDTDGDFTTTADQFPVNVSGTSELIVVGPLPSFSWARVTYFCVQV